MVRLSNHPEVSVCQRCATSLHRQAKVLEDRDRAGLGPRVRDALRGARRQIIERDWHRAPLLGPLARWTGRYLP